MQTKVLATLLMLCAVTLATIGIPTPTVEATPSDVNVALNAEVSLHGGPFFTDGWGGGMVVSEDTIVDGVFFARHHQWDQGPVWWDSHDGADRYVLIDLQDVYIIESFVVQADDNDAYLLHYWDMTTESWELAWHLPNYDIYPDPANWGMQTRPNPDDDTERHLLAQKIVTQYLTIRGDMEDGDLYFAVSEIQAFGTRMMHKHVCSLFTVTQLGVTRVVDPIASPQSAVDFYDYWSASGHTPFMEDQVGKIYLYRDTSSGELSLIMHNSIDNSVSGNMRVNFDLEGVPAGAYTALSDDPSHAWNATRPGGREFDLTLSPEGNWYHGANSDGGVIGGLPTDEAWCITINPDFIAGILAWEYQMAGPTNIDLSMEHPVTICYSPEQSLTITEQTEVQWAIEMVVTNAFPYTMTNTVITDRFGAEIEIDEPFPASITHGTVTYTTKGKSAKVFLTWEIGDLLPGETARLILLVSTDLNPAGKQAYTSPGCYELNSGATLKFIAPEQCKQLSVVTGSIHVTVLPLETP